MRVSEFNDFDELEYDALLSGSKERSWLWFGLIVSLGLHLALCAYFYRTRFQSVDAVLAANQQTPTFKVKNVDLAQALEKGSIDQSNAAAKPEPDNTTAQQPDEKKAFDKLLQEVQASAAMPDDMRDVLPEQPKVEQPDVNSVLNEIERSTAQTLSNSPNATHEQSVLNDTTASGRPQPALSGTELATSTSIKRPSTFTSKLPGDSAGPDRGRAGFSDLDQLLAQKGPLGSGTKLRLPDDQLFEYDSAALQSSAVAQLQKLGTLIKRNPKATFSVEGYTDSFGTPEYNLELSQRRADSVKQYLVEAMGISPAQIDARGYGQTKFRVSPNGSIEEQGLNRRVEVVVHTTEG
jgi:outer membrane protein OmpA-like peptidoglycan-associated protein